MELFNVTKNRYFLAVQILINRIYNGNKYTSTQFDEQLSQLSGDIDKASLNFCEKILKKNIIDIFDFSDLNHVRLKINSRVPLLPCTSEKVWLDMVLSDPHCSLFFDEKQRAALKKAVCVEKMDDVSMSIKRERVWGDDITEELGKNLRLILRAIHEKRRIYYSNHARGGDYIHKKATPCKVEYAIAEDKLRVSMWSDEEKRSIKANLSSMFDISLAEEVEDARTIKEVVQNRLLKEPLVFIVTNEHDALERAIHIFSKHRRSVIALDEKHYQFEIFYYIFEENSLISDIMAFGPRIEVLYPQYMRDKVIQRLTDFPRLRTASGADNGSENRTL